MKKFNRKKAILLEDKGVKIEVVNEVEDETSDLMQDLISTIHLFTDLTHKTILMYNTK